MPQVASATERFACEECGTSYSRERGLKRHQSMIHGAPLSESAQRRQAKQAREAPSAAVEGSVSLDVRFKLREIAAPLREQLVDIQRREVELRRELDDLKDARLQIEVVLRRLEPKAPALGAPDTRGVTDIKKLNVIEKYLVGHAVELADGFTIQSLHREMKEAGVTPISSPQKMRTLIEQLRDRGMVRMDRIVKGGGNLFVLVSRNGNEEGNG